MRSLLPVVLILAAAVPAGAGKTPRPAPQASPASNELSAHVGYQGGFGGTLGNPSGFKLFAEFAHRLSDLVWFDLQLNQVFGLGVEANCVDRFGRPYRCPETNNGGWDTEVAVGVKLKIRTPIPLVVEAPLTGALELLYNRPCEDNGAAVPVFRAGAGVKYFVTRQIGLGGGVHLAIGPGFHDAGCGFVSHSDFYGAFDFQVGAEFLL